MNNRLPNRIVNDGKINHPIRETMVASNTNPYSERRLLSKLLSEDVSSAQAREAKTLDRLAGPYNNSFVLFGAGSLGRKILAVLRKSGIEPLAFADNNSDIWDTMVDGLKVFSPEKAAERFANKAAFIVTIWSPGHRFVSTKERLQRLKCRYVIPVKAMLWKFPHDFLPHYQFDLPHKILRHSEDIQCAFDLLTDDVSRSHYLKHIQSKLFPEFSDLPIPTPDNQYFDLSVLTLLPDDVFIDSGAYNGDTIKSLLTKTTRFKKIFAFEPDPQSFTQLKSFVENLDEETERKIDLFQTATGNTNGNVYFDAAGAPGSSIVDRKNDTIIIPCVKLNSQRLMPQPTFLKFDIEGSELQALQGASEIIKRATPIITVCVYHLPDHIWKVPLYINKINKNYHFALRTHGEDGWEVVLYAIPPSRSKLKQ